MDMFWCDIKYVKVDVHWLLNIKAPLDKVEKIQLNIKWKKLRKASMNSLL